MIVTRVLNAADAQTFAIFFYGLIKHWNLHLINLIVTMRLACQKASNLLIYETK
jgi:hypothetical protein